MKLVEIRDYLIYILGKECEIPEDYQYAELISDYIGKYYLYSKLYDSLEHHYDTMINELTEFNAVHRYQVSQISEFSMELGEICARLHCYSPNARDICQYLGKLEYEIYQEQEKNKSYTSQLESKTAAKQQNYQLIDDSLTSFYNAESYYYAIQRMKNEIVKLKQRENELDVEVSLLEAQAQRGDKPFCFLYHYNTGGPLLGLNSIKMTSQLKLSDVYVQRSSSANIHRDPTIRINRFSTILDNLVGSAADPGQFYQKQELQRTLQKFAVLYYVQTGVAFIDGHYYRMFIKMIGVNQKRFKIQFRLSNTDYPKFLIVNKIALIDKDLDASFTVPFKKYKSKNSNKNTILNYKSTEVQDCDALHFNYPIYFLADGKVLYVCFYKQIAKYYIEMYRDISQKNKQHKSLTVELMENEIICYILIENELVQHELIIHDVTDKYILMTFINYLNGNTHRIVCTKCCTADVGSVFVYGCLKLGANKNLTVALDFEDCCENAVITCLFKHFTGLKLIQALYRYI